MKKQTISTLIAVTMATLIALPAHAGYSAGGSLKQRLSKQLDRMDRGISSGRISAYENKKLNQRKKEIKRLARKFKKDGKITKKERRILNAKITSFGQTITRYKTNDNYRVPNNYWQNYGRYTRHSWPYVDQWWENSWYRH